MRQIPEPELRASRAAAQLLHRPGRGRHPAEVAKAIAGVQAQDPKAGRLAFRARDARLRAADVDRARTEERSLLRAWLMRGTVHLIATEDADWMRPLFSASIASWNRRRLSQLGLDEGGQERALREIGRALESDGPLTRGELVERLGRAGIEVDQSRRTHLTMLATTSGLACLGPDRGAQTCLVLARDWLGQRRLRDREAALAELARRYLGAFGPATEADLARWSGRGLGEARTGLAAIATEISETRIAGAPAFALRRARRRSRRPFVRLLPGWDTYLLGHADREVFGDPAHLRRVIPGGGMLRPAIVVDGLVAGAWGARRSDDAIRIEVELFEELGASQMSLLEAEIEDVGRFEGLAAISPGSAAPGGRSSRPGSASGPEGG